MPFDLIGNERAVAALRAALASASPRHAFLLFGPGGTGRATAARRLAQAVNCTGDEPPCRECAQCQRIEKGIHPDVLVMTLPPGTEDAARKSISVEQVREVERAVALTPYEGRTRVVVIDPADYLSPTAQNAFLKTLEEPPPNALFALVAEAPELLLETVRSRCTTVEFGLVPASVIQGDLLARGIEETRAQLLARLAGGRPGWALAAAADDGVLERRKKALEDADALAGRPLGDRVAMAERISDSFKRERGPVYQTLLDWQSWWRDILLLQTGAEAAVVNFDLLDELRKTAAATDPHEVAEFVRALMQTRRHLGENVQSRIALDALMLAAPSRPATVRAST